MAWNGKATKTLDQWNQQAFHAMLEKQQAQKMKRPAAAKAAKTAKTDKAKGANKEKKPKAKAKATSKGQGPYGCIRCRSNLKRLCHLQKARFQRLESPWQRGLVPYVPQCQVVMDQCNAHVWTNHAKVQCNSFMLTQLQKVSSECFGFATWVAM